MLWAMRLTALIRLTAALGRTLLHRLSGHGQGAPTRPAPVAAEAPAASSPAPAASRAGKYDAALTAVVSVRPGITVAQAAAELGVPATALYPVIRRLETRAALVKLGRELHPPR
jgi:hypothetical protein